MSYLQGLPYAPFNNGNCAGSHWYQLNNDYPYYTTTGTVISNQDVNEFPAGPAFSIGPQTLPTIGDALSARGISWKYYGGGFNVANQDPPVNVLYCAICNGFQYATSIMTTPLRQNLVDLSQLYSDIATNQLPAVSFVKPDVLLDGHPGSSTPPLYESFVRKIINSVKANNQLWSDTAILITFDESGGLYDSGYIQPIDFFGDGPRTVLIAVSPYAKPGHVDHTYTDHASILKFIEWNWNLAPLSSRSRDNLPNPVAASNAPYFPLNSPAIGDLQSMFDFPRATPTPRPRPTPR
jgi:phospholipase C